MIHYIDWTDPDIRTALWILLLTFTTGWIFGILFVPVFRLFKYIVVRLST